MNIEAEWIHKSSRMQINNKISLQHNEKIHIIKLNQELTKLAIKFGICQVDFYQNFEE